MVSASHTSSFNRQKLILALYYVKQSLLKRSDWKKFLVKHTLLFPTLIAREAGACKRASITREISTVITSHFRRVLTHSKNSRCSLSLQPAGRRDVLKHGICFIKPNACNRFWFQACHKLGFANFNLSCFKRPTRETCVCELLTKYSN